MRFLLPFFVLFLFGFLGVLAMAAQIGLDDLRAVEGAPQIGDDALRALLVLQPSIILAISVAAGVALIGGTGLRSYVVDRLRGDPPPLITVGTVSGALALTAVVALAALLIDVVLRLAAPDAFAGLPGPPLALEPRITALLYGGLTEELMLRFGLMTTFLWLAQRMLGRRGAGAGTVWAVILIVALIFGAGHIPALAATVEPNTLLVTRTIALNAILGTLYGWLYWRNGLEHAMLAHGFTHGVFWLAGPLMAALAGIA